MTSAGRENLETDFFAKKTTRGIFRNIFIKQIKCIIYMFSLSYNRLLDKLCKMFLVGQSNTIEITLDFLEQNKTGADMV